MNELIYLDNAATTFPKPLTVHNSISFFSKLHCGNAGRGGHELARYADEEVYKCRKSVSDFFNVGHEENVVFTMNASMSLNICIQGLIKNGNRVVTGDFEHNSVRRPLLSFRDVVVTKVNTDLISVQNTLEAFERELNKGADYLVVSQSSNVFGKSLPIRALSDMAHRYGAKIIVDASQSAGVFDIDIRRDNIDYLCAPGHKSLYGPQGIGILIINASEIPKPLMFGGTGSNSLDAKQPDFLPDALECGTLNVPAIVGLRAGISFIQSIGVENIHNRETALLKRVYNYLLSNQRFDLYVPEPNRDYSPVISFNIKGKSSFETAELFDEYGICLRAGYHCSPDAHIKLGTLESGTVRLSIGALNTKEDIDSFIEIAEKITK